FVIVLGQLEDTRDAEAVAAKIVEAVALPVQIGMHELTVTPSLGISIFPDDGDAPGMLLKHADSAMYRMKAAGRRGYRT
ncbi:diguanylate cyclase domain-containing protein, partial [Staphylococcus aureus]